MWQSHGIQGATISKAFLEHFNLYEISYTHKNIYKTFKENGIKDNKSPFKEI